MMYEKILNNEKYLNTVEKIENTKFITNGKWDWEHGLGHYQRVADYVKKILTQLNVDDRTVEIGMVAALLHDIGLSKGDKTEHALESSRIFKKFIDEKDFSETELIMLEQAIKDHSKGNNIQTLIGLALVLADKLDVTFHRTINSSIQDKMNKEIQKIKSVDIEINNHELIVKYLVTNDFNKKFLNDWNKVVLIPLKAAKYLKKKYIFTINNEVVDYEEFI